MGRADDSIQSMMASHALIGHVSADYGAVVNRPRTPLDNRFTAIARMSVHKDEYVTVTPRCRK
jgi:hypothetical protein